MAELVIIFGCILLNGLLACVEMAFVSANRASLRQLASRGSTAARTALELRKKPERTLSVLQIGITSLGALAAAVGGAGAQDDLTPVIRSVLGLNESAAEAISVALVVGPLTYLSVVFGELVPKSIALRQPVRVSTAAARWLQLLDRLLGPAVTLLEASTRWILRVVLRFRSKPEREPTGASESLDLAPLSARHREYVVNLLELERKRAVDSMLPWNEVTFLRSDQTASEVEHIVLTSGHTRIPILTGNEVTGLLHTKEFFAFRSTGRHDWSTLVRPILRLSPKTSLLAALRAFQEARSHLAVILSHEGKPLGILTLEDVFEEMVGEIYDEDDDGLARRMIIRRPSVH